MKPSQTLEYLAGLSLVDALWWFVENCPEESKTEVFFYLRERVRNHTQGVWHER